MKCEFCGCSGTFVHENVGIVFECEGTLSQPTICDLKRERRLYETMKDRALNELHGAREGDRAYFSWLIKDHKTMIANITKKINEMEAV